MGAHHPHTAETEPEDTQARTPRVVVAAQPPRLRTTISASQAENQPGRLRWWQLTLRLRAAASKVPQHFRNPRSYMLTFQNHSNCWCIMGLYLYIGIIKI